MNLSVGTESAAALRRGVTVTFLSILALSVLFQLWRLGQSDAGAWVIVDYLMRVAGLIALAAARPTRHLAFKTKALHIGKAELALWLSGAVAIALIYDPAHELLTQILPDVRFGHIPRPSGGMHFIDLTFGLALVAMHEEIFFRRVARIVFRPLGDGAWMVLASSLLFGLFHWWSGIPNMLLATAAGIFLMLLYRRAGALWPAVLAHYLIDFWLFL